MITPDEIRQGPRQSRAAGRVLAGVIAGIVLLLAGIALGSAHSHGAIRPGPTVTVFRPGARVTVPPEIITVTATPGPP